MVDNVPGGSSSHECEDNKYKVAADFTAAGSSLLGDDNYIKEQDRLLPIANVGRIMKQILPPNAKISKEAKETMQECVSEFISFVTGEASDKCHKEKRKTVNGDDVCWALATLGFDNFVEPLKTYLHKYRELDGDKAAAAAANQNNKASSSTADDMMKLDETSIFRSDHELTNQVPPLNMFNVIERINNNISNSRPF
ncbi:Transcription factor [Macleaya cordata]|uniref:Transcription factor n=1 Tax=Macleaya cordata TaxID=56857 RepID=A0A200Q1I4_MACCD|nr:Transcription factor [Macleaya cordata]